MSDEITFQIQVPTDEEGFVLLKCPLCQELFKLKPSDYQKDSIFSIYCPGCGMVSDNYLTDDIAELAMSKVKNHANELIRKELKKLERKTKGGLISLKMTHKQKKVDEKPIMLMIDALDRKLYPCCNLEAKIKPILKASGSFCPYCGVNDYGIE